MYSNVKHESLGDTILIGSLPELVRSCLHRQPIKIGNAPKHAKNSLIICCFEGMYDLTCTDHVNTIMRRIFIKIIVT